MLFAQFARDLQRFSGNLLIAAAMGLAALLAAPAMAVPFISFDFVGEVDSAVNDPFGAGITMGDTVTGTIVFDQGAVPTDEGGNVSDFSGQPISFVLNFPDSAFSLDLPPQFMDQARTLSGEHSQRYFAGDFSAEHANLRFEDLDDVLFAIDESWDELVNPLTAGFDTFSGSFGDANDPFDDFDDGFGSFTITSIQPTATAAVPEPTSIATWSLIGLGLAGYGCYRLRRKKLHRKEAPTDLVSVEP